MRYPINRNKKRILKNLKELKDTKINLEMGENDSVHDRKMLEKNSKSNEHL